MSEDSKAQGAGTSFADIAAGIVEDCLYNIIHDIVLQTHREEKLLRMQSAATMAEQAAIAEHQENAEKAAAKGSSGAAGSTNNQAQPPSVKIDTPAAVYENGRVTLRGNPLKTTPEIVCAHCKLPRLMAPIAGVGSRLPPDLQRQYCTRHPFVSRPGHDIYNNPFPTDMAKTKKERELIKRQEKDNTPGGGSGGGSQAGDDNSQESSLSKLAAGGKPASYIPWHTCPNCKRSLLITRFAQHAEKCLGISGRQSSRNAMAKLNNSQGGAATAGNTPQGGSRVGTPIPGREGSKASSMRKEAAGDGGDGDDDGGGGGGGDTPKKVKKKSSYVKKADRERERDRDRDGDGGERREKGGGSKILKLKTGGSSGGGGSKRPPKDDIRDRKEGTPLSSGKRDRERDGGDGEETAPRKKLKLFRTESITSDMTDRTDRDKDRESPKKKKEKEEQAAAVGSPESSAS